MKTWRVFSLWALLIVLQAAINAEASCPFSCSHSDDAQYDDDVLLVKDERGEEVDINDFLIGVIENFREDMLVGIPDLKIPILDPFQEKKPLKLDVEEDKAVVHANFTGLTVKGFSKFALEDLDANLTKLSLRFQLKLPHIRAEGNYSLKGMIIKIVPLRGNGGFWVESENLTLRATASMMKIEVPSGGYRLQLADDFDVDVDFDAVKMDLENFLGGGRWTEILKRILNDLSKGLFKKFMPEIKGELNKSLLKVINKQLMKLPIVIITTGSSADDYVDEILLNVKNFIRQNNYDPMELPDYTSNFSKTIMYIEMYGEAKLYDGLLSGISSIHRTDHCVFAANKTAISVSAHLGLENLELSYKGKAHFMSVGPSIQCGGKIEKVSFYFTVDQSNRRGSKPHLRELEIMEMSTIWIHLSGLGPLTWITKWLMTGIAKLVEGVIVEKVTNNLRSYLEEEFKKVSFPV